MSTATSRQEEVDIEDIQEAAVELINQFNEQVRDLNEQSTTHNKKLADRMERGELTPVEANDQMKPVCHEVK